jgi:hypothetical protein
VSEGSVVGVWDRSGDTDRIEIKAAFFQPPDDLVGAVESEAALMASAVGASEFTVEIVDGIVDLTTASRNRFMSPLSGT